jgi:hypothetical protein
LSGRVFFSEEHFTVTVGGRHEVVDMGAPTLPLTVETDELVDLVFRLWGSGAV